MSEAIEQAWRLGTGQFADGQAENIMVKKGPSRVRLFQAVEGILFRVGNVLFEESAHVARRQLAWVAFVVKENEATRPVGVALPRPVLAKTCLRDLPDEIEASRR